MSETNSNLLNLINEESYDENDEAPTVFQPSPYYVSDDLSSVFEIPDSLKIFSQNIQSLNAKFNEFKVYFEGCLKSVFSIICLQETWLAEDSDLSLLQLNGYNLISKGRASSRHGGVAIYLKETVKYKVLPISSQANIWDGLFIEIEIENFSTSKKKIIIGNIYRPPRDNVNNYNIFISEMEQILHGLQNGNKEIAIAGDFNIDLLKIKERHIFNDYFETILLNGFIPKITLPTRITHHSSTLIDNIFVKLSNHFSSTTAGILISDISDHLGCFVSLDYIKITKCSNKYVKTWTRSERCLNAFKTELSDKCRIDIFDDRHMSDPDVNYQILDQIIKEAFQNHIPVKLVRFDRHKHKVSKWITKGILSSIKFRDKLKNRLHKTSIDSTIYQTLRTNLSNYNKVLRNLIRSAKKSYYESCFTKFRQDIKKTWNTIKSILNRNPNKKEFPCKFLINGTYVTDKQDIANQFNEYFTHIGPNMSSNIILPQNQSFEDYLQTPTHQNFVFEKVDQDTVSNIIDKLKPKASSGVDCVSSKLLKFIKNVIVAPLTLIVNQTIETGIFPKKLKIAKVVPLYKKNESFLIENYRPISVLPSMSKVLERVMHSQLVNYFSINNIFYRNQYGFRKNHSTELATLELINRMIECMDKNEVPLAIFLDLSKAFDMIDHEILIKKLHYYGVREIALKLIKSYLNDREQYITIDNTSSSLLSVTLGVPQGSILGPLLFIIFINDLHKVSSMFHPVIYADDTTLSATLRTFGPAGQDRDENINRELSKIVDWLNLNKLCLNTYKTKAMLFHSSRKKVAAPVIRINDSYIEFVEAFNYLGITIDKHISWKDHISKISVKMSKVIGIMSKLKKTLPKDILLIIYNSLFSPYLNYGTLCWKSKINHIVKLQKKAVRIIANTKYNAHTEPLFKNLNLLKIHDICSLQEFKFCYKFENNLLPEYFQYGLFTRNSEFHGHNTRNANAFHIPRVKHEYAKTGIQYIITLAFNNCPPSIQSKFLTHSMSGFASYVKKSFLDTYSLNCNINGCYICQSARLTV